MHLTHVLHRNINAKRPLFSAVVRKCAGCGARRPFFVTELCGALTSADNFGIAAFALFLTASGALAFSSSLRWCCGSPSFALKDVQFSGVIGAWKTRALRRGR
jgi:hypothetical protein